MTIDVSIANAEDTGRIAEIFYQTGKIHSEKQPDIFKPSKFENDLKYIRENIGRDNVKIFKAELEGEICGYLVMYISSYPEEFFVNPKYGFVGSIGVDERLRGKGIGKALISGAEDYLRSQNINVMEIDVYIFNEGAEKLYNSMGYKDIKHYKRKVL